MQQVQPAARKAVLRDIAYFCAPGGIHAWPSIQSVADACGLSPKVTRQHIHALESAGYLSICPTWRQNGVQTSNTYIVHWRPASDADDEIGRAKVSIEPLSETRWERVWALRGWADESDNEGAENGEAPDGGYPTGNGEGTRNREGGENGEGDPTGNGEGDPPRGGQGHYVETPLEPPCETHTQPETEQVEGGRVCEGSEKSVFEDSTKGEEGRQEARTAGRPDGDAKEPDRDVEKCEYVTDRIRERYPEAVTRYIDRVWAALDPPRGGKSLWALMTEVARTVAAHDLDVIDAAAEQTIGTRSIFPSVAQIGRICDEAAGKLEAARKRTQFEARKAAREAEEKRRAALGHVTVHRHQRMIWKRVTAKARELSDTGVLNKIGDIGGCQSVDVPAWWLEESP